MRILELDEIEIITGGGSDGAYTEKTFVRSRYPGRRRLPPGHPLPVLTSESFKQSSTGRLSAGIPEGITGHFGKEDSTTRTYEWRWESSCFDCHEERKQ